MKEYLSKTQKYWGAKFTKKQLERIEYIVNPLIAEYGEYDENADNSHGVHLIIYPLIGKGKYFDDVTVSIKIIDEMIIDENEELNFKPDKYNMSDFPTLEFSIMPSGTVILPVNGERLYYLFMKKVRQIKRDHKKLITKK